MKPIIVSPLLMFATVAVCADGVPFIVPVDKDGAQRAEVLGGDYFFKPNHIVVKVNQPLELLVRKDGWFITHSFVIDAPEAGIKINESLSHDLKTIAFAPTKVGSYPFYCEKKPPFLASQRGKGMEGVLEVVE
ncbi:cupredoxin domain-containing protein [Geobacter sp. AOG2]|uniref:cupredoxin domain-containing protein n=1 Tax=Geobacter sp. AOG2 TaxID=1566347 RepID=UPI001CC46A0F|nr:cupredoxin domain-containing protein [Geobacter sp. AOG2]GFE61055.1 hypothetical protein AOG2_16420 [Geobacter sp. AOG2]